MSAAEIIRELPKLTEADRRAPGCDPAYWDKQSGSGLQSEWQRRATLNFLRNPCGNGTG